MVEYHKNLERLEGFGYAVREHEDQPLSLVASAETLKEGAKLKGKLKDDEIHPSFLLESVIAYAESQVARGNWSHGGLYKAREHYGELWGRVLEGTTLAQVAEFSELDPKVLDKIPAEYRDITYGEVQRKLQAHAASEAEVFDKEDVKDEKLSESELKKYKSVRDVFEDYITYRFEGRDKAIGPKMNSLLTSRGLEGVLGIVKKDKDKDLEETAEEVEE